MTDGELILARTNMGALVESWLKFFYCVYYEDYIQQPKIVKNRKGGNVVIEPEKMNFETLKQFGIGILWEDREDSMYKWINKSRVTEMPFTLSNTEILGHRRVSWTIWKVSMRLLRQ